MNILVVGSGGREHALVKAMAATGHRLFIWPGNDGIRLDAEAVPVPSGDFKALCAWAKTQVLDLAVIGPEAELVAGLSDQLRAAGVTVFGPSQEAAQLEGSKIFSKEFMQEFDVPTARSFVVSTVAEASKAAKNFAPPYVLKADGLAAGKGVFICADMAELESAAKEIFVEKKLGKAGERALVEEFQPGRELSVLVLTNGTDYQVLPFARDHKRLLDDDRGPNTGGMGVVAPIAIEEKLIQQIEELVILPTLKGLQKRKFLYRGVVFIGVMLTDRGPQVLEYNTRFGDPETQTILPLLDGDWGEVMHDIAEGRVPQLEWTSQAVACIVVAAEGYPDNPVKGTPIDLPTVRKAANVPGAFTSNDPLTYILHAGTKRVGEQFQTNGGRVLNVVARASSLPLALKSAYGLLSNVKCEGMQYRKDIGKTV